MIVLCHGKVKFREVTKRLILISFFLSLPFPSQRDVVLSEPAIQVRRKGKGKQIWALEKMENRLVDMRELYQEWKELDEDNPVSEYSRMQNCSCQSASSVSSFGDILLWVTCIISLPCCFDPVVVTLCQIYGYCNTLITSLISM